MGMRKAMVSINSVNIIWSSNSILNSWLSSARRREEEQGNTNISHLPLQALLDSQTSGPRSQLGSRILKK